MGRLVIEEVGNKYSRLMVIERAKTLHGYGAFWLCQCDCGKKRIVDGSKLRDGTVKSCGCIKIRRETGIYSKDERGKTYGYLTVISRGKNRIRINSKGERRVESSWVCHCVCGKTVEVRGRILRNRPTSSCGCRGKTQDEKAFYYAFCRIRNSARQRNTYWGLSEKEVKKITSLPCTYCGRPPSQVSRRPLKGGIRIYKYNGIDRMDNKKGYSVENVVPCCKHCNSAKNTLSMEEFQNLIISIYQHWARF